MGQSADQLRQEIENNRQSAEEKLSLLEEKVTETATKAQEAVTGTMQAAQDTVTETVTQAQEKVTETVQKAKESVSVRTQVEERPLVTVGIAFLGGFLLGGLTGGDDSDDEDENRPQPRRSGSYGSPDAPASYRAAYGSSYGSSSYGSSPYGSSADRSSSRRRKQSSGMMTNLQQAAKSAGLDQTLGNAAAALLGIANSRLRDTLEQQVPGFNERFQSAAQASGGLKEKLQAAKDGDSGSSSDSSSGGQSSGASSSGGSQGPGASNPAAF